MFWRKKKLFCAGCKTVPVKRPFPICELCQHDINCARLTAQAEAELLERAEASARHLEYCEAYERDRLEQARVRAEAAVDFAQEKNRW